VGTAADNVITAKTGRTPEAVRIMRRKLGVPKFRDRRKRQGRA
jgi:hypothetical protein